MNIDTVIELHGLTKYYGPARGVSNLELEIRRGEIFGFLGPNGAGKTTTIRLLLGLIKPSSGSINILGRELTGKRKEITRDIGYLPGDFGLYQDMSGCDFIFHLLRIRNLHHNRNAIDKMEALIQRFGFDLEGKIKTYSKGMKQIVGIIQAFCHEPRLVILDEPTSGLDPLAQEKFYDLLWREKENGTTIFLSSHILKEVEKVCDRAGIIRDGKLVFVEDLRTYRSLAGKKVSLEVEEYSSITQNRLQNELGVDAVSSNANRVEFFYKGEMGKLLEYLGTTPVKDILIEVPTLEDVFLTYYTREEEHA